MFMSGVKPGLSTKDNQPDSILTLPREINSADDDTTLSPAKDLLDLDSIFDSVVEPRYFTNKNPPAVSDVDLLSDIFTTVNPAEPELASDATIHQDHTEVSLHTTGERAQVKAFEKDGLTITMDLVKDPIDLRSVNILCKFFNYTPKNFDRLIFQAAVPKYVMMEMKPASANSVSANSLGNVTQIIKVKNTSLGKPLKMLLKIQYTVGGRQIIEQAQVDSFPV
jgi:AP-1 complex subunit gamma-1